METVVLLSHKKPDDYINIRLEISELDAIPKKQATYREIKEYIKEKYGVKIPTEYIAALKREFGIIERENYNVTKKDEEEYLKNKRHCDKQRRKYIIEAFEHFGMI